MLKLSKKKAAKLRRPLVDPLQAIPAPAPGVEARKSGDGQLQLQRTFPPKPGIYGWVSRTLRYHHIIRLNLDKQGSAFWKLIDGERTLADIANAFARETKERIEPAAARQASVKFVADLMQRQLIDLIIPERAEAKR